jgi:hypothetical protein
VSRAVDESQVSAWVADLLSDAAFAEKQAAEGPYYPEKGITPETLLRYAAECREQAADPKRSLREALRGTGIPPESMLHLTLPDSSG